MSAKLDIDPFQEQRASLDDTRRMFALLARPGDVYELRGISRVNGQQHITSGYFDDLEQLARAAAERSGVDIGVYVTLNPTLPALLSRAPKNTVRRAGSGDTTSDRDVQWRRSILIDVDPVRPAGISSSREEHAGAIDLTRRIRDDLQALGWPDPILADSGNGGHLIYAVDLPVDDAGLVMRVLKALSKRYSTSTLKVDEKVGNAARISKIYGTLTRKGENTAERPHRLARIIEAPEALRCLDRATLDAFALAGVPSAAAAHQSSTNGNADRYTRRDGTRFDLDQWISANLPNAEEKPWASGRKWIIPVCPFNDQHDRGEAYVTCDHDGAPSAGCLHESCFSSWKELRTHLDTDYREREQRFAQGTHNGTSQMRAAPAPHVVYRDPSYNEHPDDATAADRDQEPAPVPSPAGPPWYRAPDLVEEIEKRQNDPWVSLRVRSEELCRVRAGGIAVVIGGSGSGKSSLVSNMLIAHAMHSGPAIALSIELPADELAARIVGIRCDASWEQVLRGQVKREFMADALNLPRLYVLDRKNATIENLAKCAAHVARVHPGEPILAAIDYAQLIQSKEREVRLRVADAFERIDDCAREYRFVALAVSQMSRASSDLAAQGERLGAESASLGAESASIERFASVTITIGKRSEPRPDGSRGVEVSIGKARMGDLGDTVRVGSYFGRTGLWDLSGEVRSAADVRAERTTDKQKSKHADIRNALVGAAHQAAGPLSRDALQRLVTKGSKKERLAVIEELLTTHTLVEVAQTAFRSTAWLVWTAERATTAKLSLVSDRPTFDLHADRSPSDDGAPR